VLKLSAWEAREFAAADYQFTLRLNFVPTSTREAALRVRDKLRSSPPKRRISRTNPFDLPARFWERMVKACGISEERTGASLSNA